ncbi:FAD-binding domain [Mycolicibacterium sp.]|uniref:FAD-binding domain n=1 Tax=Mycolicibacterium sp. TaxID=2320850 RepID=UPI001D415133|nr:FAD-binding domain [Mycolicibacterium sp.]MCB1292097.1 FAD-binding domain [Mycobacterium sp.]MCB9407827.1 FAD-binding domain [Mycolicibacterium sp.]
MRIAISGAGVAGSALAYWLQRTGHTTTLIEQAPAFRAGGYMIDFWGVGYQVAKRMGIEDRIRDAGYQVRCVRSVGPGGEVKADLRTDAIRRAIGEDFTSLPRGDLAAAVFDSVDGDCETLFGESIVAVEQRSDGVRLSLANSASRDFDLLIGADGLHSNVRGLTFGPESEFEQYLGCKVAACVVDGYRPRDELTYVTYNVPGRQVARFALRGDRTMFLFVHRAERADTGVPAIEELRDQFGAAGWECAQILDALGDGEGLYFDVVSQIRMNRWSRGRVLLIGDAAGCISLLGGEGTGLAMTEAYVLAGELMRAGGDHPGGDHRRAFERYERRLHPFIESKQAAAVRFIGFFAARTRRGLWFRNAAMRAMNFAPLTRVFAGEFRDDFELPDYGI